MTQQQRKIYQSENGESWWRCRGDDVVFVLHEANVSSGGMATRIELPQFLSSGRNAPEKQALLAMIGELVRASIEIQARSELDTPEMLGFRFGLEGGGQARDSPLRPAM